MAKWEMCKLVVKESLKCKWVAQLDTSLGQQIIDESEEFGWFSNKAIDAARSKLVARLLENGWEPIQTDEEGNAISFKRQVP